MKNFQNTQVILVSVQQPVSTVKLVAFQLDIDTNEIVRCDHWFCSMHCLLVDQARKQWKLLKMKHMNQIQIQIVPLNVYRDATENK